MAQISFTPALRQISRNLNNWENYIGEAAITLIILLLASVLVHFSRNYLAPKLFKQLRKNIPDIAETFENFSAHLILPLVLTLLCTIGMIISAEINNSSEILFTLGQLSFAWLLVRIVANMTASKAIGIFIGTLAFSGIILNSLALLEPTLHYLDRFSLTFGKIRISPYTIGHSLIVLTFLIWITSLILRQGRCFIRKRNLKPNSREVLVKFFDISVYCIAIITALQLTGIDLTALAVFGGALGVGLGFGLQKVASNFISGLLLLMERSIRVGDLIETQDGVLCWVRHMRARYLQVETFDGREIMVPNEDLITNRVINWTFSNTQARVEIKIGIAYGSNLRLAQKIILKATEDCELVSRTQKPVCFITNFADSSIEIIVYFWVDDVTNGRLEPKSEVMIAILEGLTANNISIPFPQREMHILQKSPTN
jgi:small-conductance mechanosensitive channel